MHHIVFFIYPGFELLDMAGPASVFDGANYVLSQSGKPQFYSVDLVSTKGGPVTSSSGVAVHSLRPSELARRKIDTLLIAGAHRERLLPVLADPGLRTWLPQFLAKVPRIGSVCSGAFMLAAFGQLDGRRAATHWRACAPLAATFPAVTVDSDALYVVDGRIWTSAGVTTGIDMALAMIAHDLDSTIAGEVAKGLVLYARRPGFQSQFSPLLQAQANADNLFADLIAWIQTHLDAVLDVPALAARAGFSERTFYRKFVAATGETPAYFVETARVEAARMLLSRGTSLKSVAVQVGLAPTARFVEAFERRFGVAPGLFRELHAEIGAPQVANRRPVRQDM
jgi:transcriptional regulator GlxA family with amidase domain